MNTEPTLAGLLPHVVFFCTGQLSAQLFHSDGRVGTLAGESLRQLTALVNNLWKNKLWLFFFFFFESLICTVGFVLPPPQKM